MNIIIIGATSGIGKALFLNYAKRDNRIGIVGRRTHLLEELRQQYPINTKAVTADITKLEENVTQLQQQTHTIVSQIKRNEDKLNSVARKADILSRDLANIKWNINSN